MLSIANQRVEQWIKMPSFTARNHGVPPASPVDVAAGGDAGGRDSEARLPRESPREHDQEDIDTSSITVATEPRTLPDLAEVTRRDRDVWGTSPLEPSPYHSPSSAYPKWENPAQPASQKRKRSPSVEEPQPSRQHTATGGEDGGSRSSSSSSSTGGSRHQREHSDLPRIRTTTETATAAIAASAAVVATSIEAPDSKPYSSDQPQASVEPRERNDQPGVPRSADSHQMHQQHPHHQQNQPQQPQQQQQQQEEQQQHQQQRDLQKFREQQRADLWYSSSHPTREDRHSPADEQSGNDLSLQDKEALRASTSPMSEYAGVHTPDDEDRSVSYGAIDSPSQQRRTTESGIQRAEMKRRKRNFSNRTKTGCLTCRKRKKKCDETKPECNNCVRGDFVCAGYPPQKLQWNTPDLNKQAVQIESKDPSYIPPGAYGMPGISTASSTIPSISTVLSGTKPSPGASGPLPGAILPPQRRESLPLHRGQALRIKPPTGNPLKTDDDRPTASTLPSALTSADPSKLQALSAYSAPANFFPTPVSAATTVQFLDRIDRTPKEYQRVPPLHDLARTTAEPETPQHATPLPQINVHLSGSPAPAASSAPAAPVAPAASAAPAHQLPPKQPSQQPPQMSSHQEPQLDQSHLPHPSYHQLRQQPPSFDVNNSPPTRHQLPPLQQQMPPHHHQHAHHQSFHHQSQQPQRHLSQPSHQRHPLPRQEPSPVEAQAQGSRRFSFSPPPLPPSLPTMVSHPARLVQTVQRAENEHPMEVGKDREMQLDAGRSGPFYDEGVRRERDEMVNGRPYFQFDRELRAERERCKAACWAFSNASSPALCLSHKERARLFRKILEPYDEVTLAPAPREGSVGDKVIVEAPFNADYGYNIDIGEDVYIGRNCTISDSARVTIGNRVYIGPNVSFYTVTPTDEMDSGKGVHTAVRARGITIGDDVYIGGSVTITAGATVKNGTTIPAGTTVTEEK